MKYRLDSRDWTTWGVEDLIPEHLLDQMAGIRFLHGPYVYKQAEARVKSVDWSLLLVRKKQFHPITYKESLEASLRDALGKLGPDPVMDNLSDVNLILEYAFVIKMIEERLRKESEGGFE